MTFFERRPHKWLGRWNQETAECFSYNCVKGKTIKRGDIIVRTGQHGGKHKWHIECLRYADGKPVWRKEDVVIDGRMKWRKTK